MGMGAEQGGTREQQEPFRRNGRNTIYPRSGTGGQRHDVTDVGELTTVGRDFKDESREG
jgi:hypothetical protein